MMILVSKVLTLNKIHIIDKICLGAAEVNTDQIDYFTLGNPIVNPPRVRGSIILRLNKYFITDNQDYFVYGSPVDIGSVKFGYLKPTCNIEKFINNLTCDYQKFFDLLVEFEKLPEGVIIKIMNHEKVTEAHSILSRFFDRNVVEFMFSCNDPHAWMFELSIQGSYSLNEKHIKNILYPNTYLRTAIFSGLSDSLKGKYSVYNPKYGFEGQCS